MLGQEREAEFAREANRRRAARDAAPVERSTREVATPKRTRTSPRRWLALAMRALPTRG
jgi:hypothetical protein